MFITFNFFFYFQIGNIAHLLEIMEKRDPELQITIKKLATLTLLEVFKDLLPGYQLKLDQYDGVKCKLLHNFTYKINYYFRFLVIFHPYFQNFSDFT